MVRIVGYHANENEEGEVFYTLSIQGGVEMVKSQQTGRFYLTARKTRISCTFDELTCQSLIGSELPGTIVKVDCEPYSYTIPDSQEEVMLTHTYVYQAEHAESPEEAVFAE